MAAGGGRDDEGGTTARCKSFFLKQVSVGKRWENESVVQKFPRWIPKIPLSQKVRTIFTQDYCASS